MSTKQRHKPAVAEPRHKGEDAGEHKFVRAFVLKLVGDPTLADDLVQETFLRAHKSGEVFKGDASITSGLRHDGRSRSLILRYFWSFGAMRRSRITFSSARWIYALGGMSCACPSVNVMSWPFMTSRGSHTARCPQHSAYHKAIHEYCSIEAALL